jgi:hypothetical protein
MRMTDKIRRMAAGSKIVAMVLVIAAGACDVRGRPSPDAASSASAAAAPPDTIVRRVIRRVGSPSAIQRVTGVITARRAAAPLDSVLAVRILDVRGDELPGAQVDWRLETAAPGARLTVENERTDSTGVSYARFLVGRTAEPQVVVAEASGVGAIEFRVQVPAATVRLEAPATLWSGEDAVVSATLRDSAGTELDGGRLQWATTDSSALRLAPSDSQRVVVTAALAGRAEVWAWSGNARGTIPIVVRPVLDLAVVALDDAAPQVRASISSPASVALAESGGRFRSRVGTSDDAEISIDVDPTETARYHPARLRVVRPRDLQDLRVVLVPRRWRIDAGTHAGQEVPIDADAALSPVAGRAPFWRMAPVSGRGPKTLLGWHAARLPIAIAFDRTQSAAPITPTDSAAFWDIARVLEADLGMRFFRPATVDDPDAVRVEVRPGSSEGHTFTSSTGDGDVNDGTLLFRAPSTLRDPHVVTHELVHLLGFGHSVSWPSVGVPAGGKENRLTPHDVAYIQLAMRLRRSGMTIGFPRRP